MPIYVSQSWGLYIDTQIMDMYTIYVIGEWRKMRRSILPCRFIWIEFLDSVFSFISIAIDNCFVARQWPINGVSIIILLHTITILKYKLGEGIIKSFQRLLLVHHKGGVPWDGNLMYNVCSRYSIQFHLLAVVWA